MHLRSLTMKGFKSFADPTTIELEPGITVVVGPNGSGKSNVVDAVAWVLGAQGPRIVRSAKMDDVIFAGTQKRSALGRAEVTLVIDNSDHRLPIEFSEVTIKRTLFRSGDSEYELNGVPCRLLDIQELLSDTGVGRTQHVIISQGQLDGVLSAHPEERRAVIEEAAGVLKYRRRRERAARRLEASEQNLLRVQDLLREVRRQLRPLERQASSAHQHAELSAELEVLRRYLAARELRALAATRQTLELREQELASATAVATSRLGDLEAMIAEAEVRVGTEPPDEFATPLTRLAQLLERAKGLAALIDERARSKKALLAALDDADGLQALRDGLDRVVAELERCDGDAREIASSLAELAELEVELVTAQAAEAEHADGEHASDVAARAGAARSLVEQHRSVLGAELARRANVAERVRALEERRAGIEERSGRSEQEVEALRAELALRTEESVGREEAERQAEAARQAAERVATAASEERHGLASRVEALLDALEGARAVAGVELLFGMPGVLGTLIELVEVDEGVALAFEAAVEHALSAIVVTGMDEGRAALAHLLAIGRSAALLVAPTGSIAPRAAMPVQAESLRAVVRGVDAEVDRLLDQLIGDVLLVRGGLEDALDVVSAEPGATVVTLSGDRLSPTGWRIGAARSGATKAALETARDRLATANERYEESARQRDDAVAIHERIRRARVQLDEELAPFPARLAEAQQRAAEQAAAMEVLATELTAARTEHDERDEAVRGHEEALAAAEAELALLADEESSEQVRRSESDRRRDELDQRARTLARRRSETELSEATLAERRAGLRNRERELRSELAQRSASLELASSRRASFVEENRALEGVREICGALSERLLAAQRACAGEQRRRADALARHLEQLSTLRSSREQTDRELAQLAEQRQRVEIDQTEARVRHEAAVEALRHELDLTEEELLAAPEPELAPGTDASQRRRQVERELRELGPVNLLAQEELAALTERNSFLEGQLEDIRSARRELNQVIRAVDQEIVTVFTAAFEDVARNFEHLIETLFPGGSGGISLTTPDDLLESGVEIEARPAGRNVRRLSLLSGGERSLVALAFLFAVFRSRPSPFYLMDEVEAALDDANLQRFLALIDDFRDEAQLVVVSHQKRTMEVADALYGISMQPGGASRVVSERLRAQRPARDIANVHSVTAAPST